MGHVQNAANKKSPYYHDQAERTVSLINRAMQWSQNKCDILEMDRRTHLDCCKIMALPTIKIK